jgi:hypothetical protein
MSIRHIIPRGELSAEHKRLVKAEIDSLPDNRAWLVQVKRYQRRRSLEQNAFLHAVPLRLICDHTGMEMDDIKTYLMSKAFGTKEIEIAGETISRPMKGTSDLDAEQFSWFLEWIEQWAAQELGMVIPRPNEVIEEEL